MEELKYFGIKNYTRKLDIVQKIFVNCESFSCLIFVPKMFQYSQAQYTPGEGGMFWYYWQQYIIASGEKLYFLISKTDMPRNVSCFDETIFSQRKRQSFDVLQYKNWNKS